MHGSNGISDVATGALKFFIIDGSIYNGSNGQYKDYAWSAGQPSVMQVPVLIFVCAKSAMANTPPKLKETINLIC